MGEGILDLLGQDRLPAAVGGMSIGADPITAAVVTMSAIRGTPIRGFLIRKEPKGHGTNQYIEGPVRSGEEVAIVEDVVTTGGSSVAAIERAEAFGLKVVRVIGIVNRMEGGRRRLPGGGVRSPACSPFAISESNRRRGKIRQTTGGTPSRLRSNGGWHALSSEGRGKALRGIVTGMGAIRQILLRGVEVHNLKGIDLDIPHQKLVVLCGLSGSGKSSLALDTLYAEGQQRYIESFSAYTRQFLERLERPEAERIDGIPPAIAVTSKNASRSSRSTVGTATETSDYLRLLYARTAQVLCRQCGQEVRRDSPQSAAESLEALPAGTRYMIAFPLAISNEEEPSHTFRTLQGGGFIRVIADGRLVNLTEVPTELSRSESRQRAENLSAPGGSGERPWYVVVDRLSAGSAADRIRDSLETAFAKGEGRCYAFVEDVARNVAAPAVAAQKAWCPPSRPWTVPAIPTAATGRGEFRGFSTAVHGGEEASVRGWHARTARWNTRCRSRGSIVSIVRWAPALPARDSGTSSTSTWTWSFPIPESRSRKGPSLRGKARPTRTSSKNCWPWLPTTAFRSTCPFASWPLRTGSSSATGCRSGSLEGLRGFFAWLERRKYKMHIRVFLSRWRSYHLCPECGGTRLRPEALAARIGGKSIAEISAMKISDAARFFREVPLTDWQRQVGRMMLEQIAARLGYLEAVGLGYLALDRTLRTLSGGEVRRVALTSALGSSLVNMLYVLDEPSIGLHPRDIQRLIGAIQGLRDRGNTVVVVEHEEAILRAADQVIEIGPGAGERGGRVVFQGTPQEMEASTESLTGDYLAGRRGTAASGRRRLPDHGWIRLSGARGNNLKNITVEFPLGVLCVVAGVSGSGKSTLVQDTLYPALGRRMRKETSKPCDYDDVYGDGQIDDLVMVDQSPIGRSPRSNPVTYLKAFDEIRAVFAETPEARTRGYTAGHFSFNSDDGRCQTCKGDGQIEIDMQFLADVFMKCGQCHGTRYRDEILEVTYRGRSIADILEMTVREAFTFFRGRAKFRPG